MRPISKATFSSIRNEDAGGFNILKKEYLILLLVALAIVLLQFFFYKPASRFPIITPRVVSADEVRIAEKFPASLKLVGKKEVTEAYEATYPNSTVAQATAVFISSESPEKNYDHYLKWAKDNGWTVINDISRGPVLSLYLRKGIEDLNIVIHGSSVNISHIKK